MAENNELGANRSSYSGAALLTTISLVDLEVDA